MTWEKDASTTSQDLRIGAPCLWAREHGHLIQPGARVLDLAAGSGRHALWAAELGAAVTAVERDPARMDQGRRAAEFLDLKGIEWVAADLTSYVISPRSFDVVLMFSYLDRSRLPHFLDAVKPGGYFIAETFLIWQRELGWGPTREDFLLQPGELWRLVRSFELVIGREALEPSEHGIRAVASVVALRAHDS